MGLFSAIKKVAKFTPVGLAYQGVKKLAGGGGPSIDQAEMDRARALRGQVMDSLSGQLASAGKGIDPVEQAQLATQAGQRSLSDTERQGLRGIQQGIARRGIAGLTSVGLGAGAQVQQDIGRQRLALASNQPMLQEQFRQAQRQEVSQAAQNLLGSGFLPEYAAPKKSRLQKFGAPVLGAVGAGIGGLMGGAQGAKAGGTVGLGVGRAFQ